MVLHNSGKEIPMAAAALGSK
ncbi:MAG: hypothetical protein RLZZ214_3327, partial [Verrucomicrobiota bacterium]